MAHLAEMISDVASQVGLPSMRNLRQTEVVYHLNQGQYIVGHHLLDIGAWPYETTAFISTTGGTAAYELFRDMDDIILVRYDSDNASTYYRADEIPMADRSVLDENTFYSASQREPFFSVTGSLVTVYPTPTTTTTNGIEITYRRVPPQLTTERNSRDLTASSNGAAGGTTIVDTALTQRDDFWNGCEVVMESGTYAGERREVSDFVNSTTTLTVRTAFSGQIDSDDVFSLYDFSIIPVQYHHLIVLYAVSMCLAKLERPQEASAAKADMASRFEQLAKRFTQPIGKQLYDTERTSKTNRN